MNMPDRLSPEEHALARLLGRPTPGLGPDATLDARILTLARQAEATHTTPAPLPSRPAVQVLPRHRRRRMVSSLAAAASLVLVVGLAWQLRPAPPPLQLPQTMTEISPAAVASHEPAPATALLDQPVASSPAGASIAPETEALPAKPAVSTQKTQARPAAPARTASATARAAQARSAEAEPLVPPSPPAPPAPASYAIQPPPATQDAVIQGRETQRLRAAAPAAAAAASPAIAARTEVEEAQTTQAVLADATLPRRQWLQRIRERRDAGDHANARASLKHFLHTYPQARVPRDLRDVLQTTE